MKKAITTTVMLCVLTLTLSHFTAGNPDITLANIEAIASGEETGKINCFASIEIGNEGSRVIYCGTCTTEEGYKPTCIESACLGFCTKN